MLLNLIDDNKFVVASLNFINGHMEIYLLPLSIKAEFIDAGLFTENVLCKPGQRSLLELLLVTKRNHKKKFDHDLVVTSRYCRED